MTNRLKIAFIALCLCACATTVDAEPGFNQWRQEFAPRAKLAGISQKTIDKTLPKLSFVPRVIELDRQQPEFKLSLEEYQSRVLTPARIAQGAQLWDANQKLFQRLEKEYGVEPQILLALWAIETRYGEVKGGFDALSALATLAYEGRRAAYFEKELIASLKLIDSGKTRAKDMRASWAGAMGQTQFMPTTLQRYGVDGNGDGKIDVWNNKADALTSGANYLKGAGWKHGQSWGQEISPNDPRLAQYSNDPNFLKIGGNTPHYFLLAPNYQVFLNWNRSHLFAITVGQLADAIKAKKSTSGRTSS
ncbi:MAG: lytic transglycosylase domain-containing protein [Dongiaceae bacterium]